MCPISTRTQARAHQTGHPHGRRELDGQSRRHPFSARRLRGTFLHPALPNWEAKQHTPATTRSPFHARWPRRYISFIQSVSASSISGSVPVCLSFKATHSPNSFKEALYICMVFWLTLLSSRNVASGQSVFSERILTIPLARAAWRRFRARSRPILTMPPSSLLSPLLVSACSFFLDVLVVLSGRLLQKLLCTMFLQTRGLSSQRALPSRRSRSLLGLQRRRDVFPHKATLPKGSLHFGGDHS